VSLKNWRLGKPFWVISHVLRSRLRSKEEGDERTCDRTDRDSNINTDFERREFIFTWRESAANRSPSFSLPRILSYVRVCVCTRACPKANASHCVCTWVRVRLCMRTHVPTENSKSDNRSPNTSQRNVWTNIRPVGDSAVYRSATIDQIKDPRSIDSHRDSFHERSMSREFGLRFCDAILRHLSKKLWDINWPSPSREEARWLRYVHRKACIKRQRETGTMLPLLRLTVAVIICGKCIKNERCVVAFSLNARNRSGLQIHAPRVIARIKRMIACG